MDEARFFRGCLLACLAGALLIGLLLRGCGAL